jgi:hypothetical protein
VPIIRFCSQLGHIPFARGRNYATSHTAGSGAKGGHVRGKLVFLTP